MDLDEFYTNCIKREWEGTTVYAVLYQSLNKYFPREILILIAEYIGRLNIITKKLDLTSRRNNSEISILLDHKSNFDMNLSSEHKKVIYRSIKITSNFPIGNVSPKLGNWDCQDIIQMSRDRKSFTINLSTPEQFFYGSGYFYYNISYKDYSSYNAKQIDINQVELTAEFEYFLISVEEQKTIINAKIGTRPVCWQELALGTYMFYTPNLKFKEGENDFCRNYDIKIQRGSQPIQESITAYIREYNL